MERGCDSRRRTDYQSCRSRRCPSRFETDGNRRKRGLTTREPTSRMTVMGDTVTTEKAPAQKPQTFTSRAVRPNGRERQPQVEKKEESGPPKTVIREY